jgi:hypothetical protein
VEGDIGEGSCAFRGWKGAGVVELTSEDRLTVTVALDDGRYVLRVPNFT